MMQNPSPSTGRHTTQQQPRLSTAIKRDVNLLPANQNSEKKAQRGTIILFGLLGAGLLAWLIILMPMNDLKGLQDKAAAAESQLEAKKQYESEFNDLVARRDALKQMQDSLQSSEKAYLPPADLMALISRTCPDTITLLNLTQDSQSVTVTGLALSDTDIAQFLVNMKSLPSIYGAVIKSVQDDTVTGNSKPKRLFEATARLIPEPPPEATPAPAATPAPTTKGGDGK